MDLVVTTGSHVPARHYAEGIRYATRKGNYIHDEKRVRN